MLTRRRVLTAIGYDVHRIHNMRHKLSLLAYEMNGQPLTVLHGAPLRLRCENELGFKMVKWIEAIEFVEDFNPTSPAASPRNAVVGHAIGILCGYGALWLTGLRYAPPAIVMGVGDPRIIAAAVSLAATGAIMILFNVAHPPAAATTLIISLGIITTPIHLCIIELAVVVLALQAILVNRLSGVNYPVWTERPGWADRGGGGVR